MTTLSSGREDVTSVLAAIWRRISPPPPTTKHTVLHSDSGMQRFKDSLDKIDYSSYKLLYVEIWKSLEICLSASFPKPSLASVVMYIKKFIYTLLQ